MPRILYKEHRFSNSTMYLLDQANQIVEEYSEQGYDLTLRQLYYQLVSRDIIPNKQTEYNRLGDIIKNARLAGLMDWNAIVDRTRNLRSQPHWESPQDIVKTCAQQFRIDKWAGQQFRPEVWIEKDALIGVIEGICNELDIPYFSCRGYTSISEVWRAGQRCLRWMCDYEETQTPLIIHLGDHDPSGIDMTRDIRDRLELFIGDEIEVNRIALNMDQITTYNPPPNPTKLTDSRAGVYMQTFGTESWELDALNPTVIRNLIKATIMKMRDNHLWEEKVIEEQEQKHLLQSVANNWQEVISKFGDT